MSDNKLVLHPVNPWAILQDPEALLEALRGNGLIGAAFSHVGELHYRAGSRFKDLLVFREGAPGESTGPATYHASLLETTDDPNFLGASNTQPPICPGCQGKLANWTTQLGEWHLNKRHYLWACAACGRKSPVAELDWGPTGGVARYSLDLWNIQQDEAAPSKELLACLEHATFESWRYFYYRF